MGLLYVMFGLVVLFASIAVTFEFSLSEILMIGTESYNYLLREIVNIVSAYGLIHKMRNMQGISLIFDAMMAAGSL